MAPNKMLRSAAAYLMVVHFPDYLSSLVLFLQLISSHLVFLSAIHLGTSLIGFHRSVTVEDTILLLHLLSVNFIPEMFLVPISSRG